jgi:hypothetical protein
VQASTFREGKISQLDIYEASAETEYMIGVNNKSFHAFSIFRPEKKTPL